MKYLELLQRRDISPNFWCSEEYWEKAGWEELEGLSSCRVIDSEGIEMLPPVSDYNFFDINASYWTGFPNQQPPKGTFLDHEFIYEPIPDMEDLPGGEWRTTRKNMNKVLREYDNCPIFIPTDEDETDPGEIADVFEEWTSANDIKTIEDPDVMIKFVTEGRNRLSLYLMGRLSGILVFDMNWKYINFRYCVVRPLPGLSDYARIWFRHMVYHRYPGKLINDGGSLGRDSLYQYKKRLCPLEINKIWSTL